MDRDALKRVFSENIDKWVRVIYEDETDQLVYVINVDGEGYVLKPEDDPDGMYWTTFDDVESVSPISDHKPDKT